MKISVIAARYNKVAKAGRCNQEKGLSVKGYCSGAGGLPDRADASNILIVGLNGEVSRAKGQTIEPGDRILVMPRFDSNNLQPVKDVTRVLYQMGVAVKGLWGCRGKKDGIFF